MYQNQACSQQTATVLVIDDEPDIAQVVGQIIQMTGKKAAAYSNPVHAVKAFEANPNQYAAVITDWRMPEMSGQDVAKNVREISQQIPIIVITANENYLSPGVAKELAISHLLKKPFSLNELVSVVQNLPSLPN